MADWWSIEVLHGEFSAFQWQQSYDSDLIEAGLTNGALDGTWHAGTWGVAFEVCFNTAEEWEAFRNLPLVRAALDAVPDPVNGLLIYRGRGGSSASGKPRRPRPAPSASSLALPEPTDAAILDLTGAAPPELAGAMAIPGSPLALTGRDHVEAGTRSMSSPRRGSGPTSGRARGWPWRSGSRRASSPRSPGLGPRSARLRTRLDSSTSPGGPLHSFL